MFPVWLLVFLLSTRDSQGNSCFFEVHCSNSVIDGDTQNISLEYLFLLGWVLHKYKCNMCVWYPLKVSDPVEL